MNGYRACAQFSGTNLITSHQLRWRESVHTSAVLRRRNGEGSGKNRPKIYFIGALQTCRIYLFVAVAIVAEILMETRDECLQLPTGQHRIGASHLTTGSHLYHTAVVQMPQVMYKNKFTNSATYDKHFWLLGLDIFWVDWYK